MSAEIDELRGRWQGTSVDTNWVRRKLGDRDSKADFLDLRGLPIEEIVKGIKFENVDLSFAQFSGAGQLIECQFSGSKLQSIQLNTNIGNQFTDCDFQGADLTELQMRGRFQKCNFSGCKFDNARGIEVKFIDCDFSGCILKKTDFKRCLFENCDFEGASFLKGVLSGSRFVGKRPLETAFKNVHMPEVIFA